MAKTVASRKAKGRAGSQEVRELILKYLPDLKPDDIQVVPGGVTGEDLWLSPRARELLPLVSEVKNQEAIQIWKALKQSEEHKRPEGTYPVLWFKRNRSKMYVALEAEHFLKLVL